MNTAVQNTLNATFYLLGSSSYLSYFLVKSRFSIILETHKWKYFSSEISIFLENNSKSKFDWIFELWKLHCIFLLKFHIFIKYFPTFLNLFQIETTKFLTFLFLWFSRVSLRVSCWLFDLSPNLLCFKFSTKFVFCDGELSCCKKLFCDEVNSLFFPKFDYFLIQVEFFHNSNFCWLLNFWNKILDLFNLLHFLDHSLIFKKFSFFVVLLLKRKNWQFLCLIVHFLFSEQCGVFPS